MKHTMYLLTKFFFVFIFNPPDFFITGEDISVKISTKNYVNLVSDNFLSFTIDPKFLLINESSTDCLCMAKSLSPAYIRIAGVSTAYMTINNSTLALENGRKGIDSEKNSLQHNINNRVTISVNTWANFAHWAQMYNFTLMFALNNEDRVDDNGLWDPNTALKILSEAETAKIGQAVWQLGYECNGQSVDEYLNDLQTLKIIVDTFESGRNGKWKVAGCDIAKCVSDNSTMTLREFMTISNQIADLIFLDRNFIESQNEDELIDLKDELKTAIWTSDREHDIQSDQQRAIDWLNHLGMTARDGYSVHLRELTRDEFIEPSLSYYMALLYKNLVGNRVLNVDISEMDNSEYSGRMIMFAHCTTLKHKHVPGAITLYGSNTNDVISRFVVKLKEREEGGDIMQYILSADKNGNIMINGKKMLFEGDLRPSVKRVRPFKKLIISLPPKSFGFWVLANTNIKACLSHRSQHQLTHRDYKKHGTNELLKDLLFLENSDEEKRRRKRSVVREMEDKDVREIEKPVDPSEYDVYPKIHRDNNIVKKDNPFKGDTELLNIFGDLRPSSLSKVSNIQDILENTEKLMHIPKSHLHVRYNMNFVNDYGKAYGKIEEDMPEIIREKRQMKSFTTEAPKRLRFSLFSKLKTDNAKDGFQQNIKTINDKHIKKNAVKFGTEIINKNVKYTPILKEGIVDLKDKLEARRSELIEILKTKRAKRSIRDGDVTKIMKQKVKDLKEKNNVRKHSLVFKNFSNKKETSISNENNEENKKTELYKTFRKISKRSVDGNDCLNDDDISAINRVPKDYVTSGEKVYGDYENSKNNEIPQSSEEILPKRKELISDEIDELDLTCQEKEGLMNKFIQKLQSFTSDLFQKLSSLWGQDIPNN